MPENDFDTLVNKYSMPEQETVSGESDFDALVGKYSDPSKGLQKEKPASTGLQKPRRSPNTKIQIEPNDDGGSILRKPVEMLSEVPGYGGIATGMRLGLDAIGGVGGLVGGVGKKLSISGDEYAKSRNPQARGTTGSDPLHLDKIVPYALGKIADAGLYLAEDLAPARDFDKGMWEQLKDGEYGEFAKQSSRQALASAPYSVPYMAGGPVVGGFAMYLSASGQKYAELEKDPTLTERQRRANADTSGILAATSEMIGGKVMGAILKGVKSVPGIGNVRKYAGKAIEPILDMAGEAAKTTLLSASRVGSKSLAAGIEEGVFEEGMNQFGENILDMLMGVKRSGQDVTLFMDVPDAIIGGFTAGVFMNLAHQGAGNQGDPADPPTGPDTTDPSSPTDPPTDAPTPTDLLTGETIDTPQQEDPHQLNDMMEEAIQREDMDSSDLLMRDQQESVELPDQTLENAQPEALPDDPFNSYAQTPEERDAWRDGRRQRQDILPEDLEADTLDDLPPAIDPRGREPEELEVEANQEFTTEERTTTIDGASETETIVTPRPNMDSLREEAEREADELFGVQEQVKAEPAQEELPVEPIAETTPELPPEVQKQKDKNLDYDGFLEEMDTLLQEGNKYTPEQAGFGVYAEKMADLSDAYPEHEAKWTGENRESTEKPAPVVKESLSVEETPTKQPWEMTRDEYADNKFENEKDIYKKRYEEMEMVDDYKTEARQAWTDVLSEAAEDHRLPDYVIDEFVELYGETDLFRLFRGRLGKGIEGWEPADRRLYDKTYRQILKDPNLSGLTNRGEKKDMHRRAIKKALSEGRTVPDKVLKDYPELTAPAQQAESKVEKPKPEPVVKESLTTEVEKQPWETSDLADSPNIPSERVKAKKQADGTYKLLYTGTENEVFAGEKFKSVREARGFFEAQKVKAQAQATENTSREVKETPPSKTQQMLEKHRAKQSATNKESLQVAPTVSKTETVEKGEAPKTEKLDTTNQELVAFRQDIERSGGFKPPADSGLTWEDLGGRLGPRIVRRDGRSWDDIGEEAVNRGLLSEGYTPDQVAGLFRGRAKQSVDVPVEAPKVETHDNLTEKAQAATKLYGGKSQSIDETITTLKAQIKTAKADSGETDAAQELLNELEGGNPTQEDMFGFEEDTSQSTDEEEALLFSTQDSKAKGPSISTNRVEKAISKLKQKWAKSNGTITVVAKQSDLPAHIQKKIKKGQRVRGVYSGSNVILVAENIHSEDEAIFVVLHETVGHKGIRQALKDMGVKADPFFRRLRVARLSEIIDYVGGKENWKKLSPEEQLVATEEWLADKVGARDYDSLGSWWSKFKTFLREAIRQITGKRMDLNDSMLEDLFGQAKKGLESGKGIPSKASIARFSEKASTSDTDYLAAVESKDMDTAQQMVDDGQDDIRFSTAKDDMPDSESMASDALKETKDITTAPFKEGFNGAINFIKVLGEKEKGPKDDLSALHVLGTPLFTYDKVPGMKRLFHVANSLMELKHLWENKILDLHHIGGATFSELKQVMDIAVKHKEGWKLVQKGIIQNDINKVGYTVKVAPNKDTKGTDYTVFDPHGKKQKTFDNEGEAWSFAFDEHRNKMEKHLAKEFGEEAAKELADGWLAVRHILDREYRAKRDRMLEAQAEMEDSGKPLPKVWIEGEDKPISLMEALRRMGDLRGSYYPRIRNSGRFMLWVSKEGEPPILKVYGTRLGRKIGDAAYQRDGYTTRKEDTGKPSETAYTGFDIVSQNDVLKAALRKTMKKANKGAPPVSLEELGITFEVVDYPNADGVVEKHLAVKGVKGKRVRQFLKDLGARRHKGDDFLRFHTFDDKLQRTIGRGISHIVKGEQEIAHTFAQNMITDLADTLNARGSRSSMISRDKKTGDDVHRGYEEDVIKAITLAAKRTAGGNAKNEMLKEALRVVMGTDVSWEQFQKDNPIPKGADKKEYLAKLWEKYEAFVEDRRIDSSQQPIAFAEAKSLIDEMARNPEAVERVIGAIRGYTAFKHLSGIAPGIVNLTAMAITVPASLHAHGGIKFKRGAKLVAESTLDYVYYVGVEKGVKDKVLKKLGVDSESGGKEKRELDAETKRVLKDIRDLGFDDAQYNAEAVAALRSTSGAVAQKIVDLNMLVFMETEKINRGSTILAAFKGLREQHEGDLSEAQYKEMLHEAKEISDKAHGVYTSANRPIFTRGGNAGSQTLRSWYMYKTFTHTYLQNWFRMFAIKDFRAAAWMSVAPGIIGGANAVGGAFIVKAMFQLFGEEPPEEVEEEMYEWLAETFHPRASDLARTGIAGQLGFDLRGSLSIDPEDMAPNSLSKLAGAPYSAVSDHFVGISDIMKGNTLRGLEKQFPRYPKAWIQAYREYTEGITKGNNTPLIYEDELIKPGLAGTIIRGLTFNPEEISVKREKLWAESVRKIAYSKRRSEINSRIKGWYLRGSSPSKWPSIQKYIDVYNDDVKDVDGVGDIGPDDVRRLKKGMDPSGSKSKSKSPSSSNWGKSSSSSNSIGWK